MATRPVSNNPAVAEYYATQVATTEAFLAALLSLQPQLTPEPTPEYLAQVAALVELYSLASISHGADYYEALRELAGVLAPFTLPIVDPPESAAVEAAILAALADAGIAPDLEEAEILDAVQNLIEGITATLVQEAGRDEVWTAIENDVAAVGWARVTRPGACAFCRMLATRGAVYKTERSASFKAHMKDEHGGGDCQCQVEPLFAKRYEPPAHVREDQVTWAETGSLYDFRRAIEGRTDGPSHKRTRVRGRR